MGDFARSASVRTLRESSFATGEASPYKIDIFTKTKIANNGHFWQYLQVNKERKPSI